MLIRHYSTSPYSTLGIAGVLVALYYLHLFQRDPAARQIMGKVSRKLSPAVN
jgi:hypothetical protein